MPYFVFKIRPPKKLEFVASHAAYQEARNASRELRAQIPSGEECLVKMVFAKHQLEAEALLREEREAPPMGDD